MVAIYGKELSSTADWGLQTCCDTREYIFIVLYFLYGFLIHCFFHRGSVLKPFKLLGVFFHEWSHASATWITCGKVKKIEVYNNEGGVTHFTGGAQCIVIPAGYVGGAFWGGAFVALSGHRIGATVGAVIISMALMGSLCYKPNKTVVFISVGFTIVTLAAIAVDWFVIDPFLQYVMLFYGVFFGYYAVRDIWDDTVKETKEGSDAVACNKLISCCLPRCVGIQFMLVGLIFQIVGIYLAVVWLVTTLR